MQSPLDPAFIARLVRSGVLGVLLCYGAAPCLPGGSQGLRAQSVARTEAEMEELVDEARDRQEDFEFLRQRRTPKARLSREGGCDEQIGRICIWFGGAGEADFPPELPEVGQERRKLVALLLEAERQIDDPWITGQFVHYLVEAEALGAAEEVARACTLEEEWWCRALLGYALHVQDRFVEAEEAFRSALATMPDEVRERWNSPRYIVTRDAEEWFDEVDGAERQARWESFWRLSDPLFLVEGNDRLTEHWARVVEAMNREDAAHPQGLGWEEDLEETLIRYGRTIGFSSTLRPSMPGRGGGMGLLGARRMIAHHRPESRGYRFPEAFLASPADIPPESWITAPREAFSWYVPPYAPDFRALETQVGRFRRGDEMLLVGAYQPEPPPPGDEASPFGAANPFESMEGSLETALFLIPVDDGGDAVRVEASEPEGVLTLRAAPGSYVSSLELFDRRGGRAWRARQGVRQTPLVPGLVGVSDLLVLRPRAPLPDSLAEAIPMVRPGVRIRPGEEFVVVWEVYGLRIEESVQVSIGFSEGHPDFLRPVEDFEEILPPDGPVEIQFIEPGPERIETVFRALEMQLPELDAGPYTLHLRLDLPGREPVVTSRPIVVEG